MTAKAKGSQIKRIGFSRYGRALINLADRAKKIEAKVLCPFCQSRRLVRRGKVKVKKAVDGVKQRYFCFNCNKFTLKPIEK